MNGQGQIIGSRVDGTSQRQYIADVNSQGALKDEITALK